MTEQRYRQQLPPRRAAAPAPPPALPRAPRLRRRSVRRRPAAAGAPPPAAAPGHHGCRHVRSRAAQHVSTEDVSSLCCCGCILVRMRQPAHPAEAVCTPSSHCTHACCSARSCADSACAGEVVQVRRGGVSRRRQNRSWHARRRRRQQQPHLQQLLPASEPLERPGCQALAGCGRYLMGQRGVRIRPEEAANRFASSASQCSLTSPPSAGPQAFWQVPSRSLRLSNDACASCHGAAMRPGCPAAQHI